MARRLRGRPSNTLLLIFGSGLVLVLLAVAGLNRPLPNYLVASSNLPQGAELGSESVEELGLELGALSETYATREDALDKVLLQPVASGELIPIRILGPKATNGLTAIRFTPDLKPANPITIGSKVAIWQVIEIEEIFQSQLLVTSALVSDLLYGDGLFAGELPEVEVAVSDAEATLLLSALSSEAAVYLLPRS